MFTKFSTKAKVAVLSGFALFLVSCVGNKAKKEQEQNKKPVEQDLKKEQIKQKIAESGADRTFFAFDSSKLTAEGKKLVSKKAKVIKENNLKVEIAGHCDERGSEAYNYQLGLRRAIAVKNELIKLGVSPESISVISHGKTKPFAAGSDEKSWKQNRVGVFSFEKYTQLSLTTSTMFVSIDNHYSDSHYA